MDINVELAKAMGIHVHKFEYDKELMSGPIHLHKREALYFDYKDPAICLENIKWLLDNKYGIYRDGEIVIENRNNTKEYYDADKDLCLAAAKARIEASKNE